MSQIRKENRLSTTLNCMLMVLMLSAVWGGFYISTVVSPAQAAMEDDTSKRDTDNEVAGASKDAKGKLDGFTGGVSGFFEGISNWIGGIFQSMDDSINGMFGGEEDAGMGAFFGTVVWAIIFIVVLFLAAFAYNIIKGILGGGNSSVSERYRKE